MWRVLGISLLLTGAAAQALAQSNDFRWSGAIARGKAVEIKGVNGEVRAEFTSGNQVEVVATRSARRSDPASVSVQVVQEDGNVTICAVYPTPSRRYGRNRNDRDDRNRNDGPNECRPGSGGHMNVDDNDVRVDFIIKVPAGVKFFGRTVNGSIDARGLQSDADVETVNGKIALETTGVGSANTVNGSIDASLGSTTGNEPLEFRTVNGSITVKLPKDLNAVVHAHMLNGGFDSDFPVMVQSFRGRNKRISGTIGKGGRDLDLDTVNGSIHLQSVPR
jgi:DUF4097 and DUF4098 domain-containing protein YvlB